MPEEAIYRHMSLELSEYQKRCITCCEKLLKVRQTCLFLYKFLKVFCEKGHFLVFIFEKYIRNLFL